jgi:hypothetical protein
MAQAMGIVIGQAIDLEIDADAESAVLNECLVGEPTGTGSMLRRWVSDGRISDQQR